jgi:hypothetical protein
MSQGSGQGGADQPEVRWDLFGAVSHTCDVANSAAGPDDVVLNFGATQRNDTAPAEVSVRMLRRITLRPMTARTLRDMLRDVIADIDADKPRGQS